MKKRIVIILCILTVLAGCVYIVGCFNYSGIFLNQFGYEHDVEAIKQLNIKSPDALSYNRFHMFKNWFGRNAVVMFNYENREYVPLGTYTPVFKTHLATLSLRKGMTVQQLVATLGMPDGVHGSGMTRLHYDLSSGYGFDVFFNYKSDSPEYDPDGFTISGFGIEDPEGNYSMVDEVVEAFQWKVRLVYLGIAAFLVVILVCLLKIPPIIRKRKLKPATE